MQIYTGAGVDILNLTSGSSISGQVRATIILDSLSDFTATTQKSGALVLHLHPGGRDPEYDGGIYLRLLGVTADQITDAIFT